MSNRVFAGVAALVAGAAIVAGLLTIDPPWTVRRVRLDNERASGLNALTEAIGRFANDKARLPQSLDELQQPSSQYRSYRPAIDPISGTAYEYIPGAGFDYQLCATFDIASKDARVLSPAEFPHGPGRTCFNRTAPGKATAR